MSNQPSKEPLRQIQISMPFSMVDAIDAIVREEGGSRAGKIREWSSKGLANRNGRKKS